MKIHLKLNYILYFDIPVEQKQYCIEIGACRGWEISLLWQEVAIQMY